MDRNIGDKVNELGKTKIKDGKEAGRLAKDIGRGLFARYRQRYFVRNGGNFMPIVHLMFLVGIIGYAFEYPHLKKGSH